MIGLCSTFSGLQRSPVSKDLLLYWSLFNCQLYSWYKRLFIPHPQIMLKIVKWNIFISLKCSPQETILLVAVFTCLLLIGKLYFTQKYILLREATYAHCCNKEYQCSTIWTAVVQFRYTSEVKLSCTSHFRFLLNNGRTNCVLMAGWIQIVANYKKRVLSRGIQQGSWRYFRYSCT
jgi:hypothetical protein